MKNDRTEIVMPGKHTTIPIVHEFIRASVAFCCWGPHFAENPVSNNVQGAARTMIGACGDRSSIDPKDTDEVIAIVQSHVLGKLFILCFRLFLATDGAPGNQ